MSKPKRHEPALSASHSYPDFPGHAAFVQAAMARSGLPPRILPRVTASVPIQHLGRVLAGLAETSRRNRARPLWSNEIALVRSTLLGVEETRWHYRVAATASFSMAEDARRAFALDAAEEIPAATWRFAGVDPYFRAEGERLGLPGVFARRGRQAPEVHRIATRLGELHRRYQQAPKDAAGRPILSLDEAAVVRSDIACAAEEATVLHALAEASEAMLGGAYAGFGLAMPTTPPPDMPECKGCSPILNARRTRGKVAPYFA